MGNCSIFHTYIYSGPGKAIVEVPRGEGKGHCLLLLSAAASHCPGLPGVSGVRALPAGREYQDRRPHSDG